MLYLAESVKTAIEAGYPVTRGTHKVRVSEYPTGGLVFSAGGQVFDIKPANKAVQVDAIPGILHSS